MYENIFQVFKTIKFDIKDDTYMDKFINITNVHYTYVHICKWIKTCNSELYGHNK